MSEHEKNMSLALEYAAEASKAGEVPVGCVITDENGKIIGWGRNMREEKKDACSHAETEAIRMACASRGNWRLSGCSIYVTLEPCPMCAGAIINARLDRVFYGAKDELTGSCGSVINLFMENYGQKTKIYGGILEDQCAGVLRKFFSGIRE